MAQQKRIALTLDPEYHELLKELAAYQNKTVVTVVRDFLEISRPVAMAMKKAFEDLHAGKDQNEVYMELLASGLEASAKQLKNKD